MVEDERGTPVVDDGGGVTATDVVVKGENAISVVVKGETATDVVVEGGITIEGGIARGTAISVVVEGGGATDVVVEGETATDKVDEGAADVVVFTNAATTGFEGTITSVVTGVIEASFASLFPFFSFLNRQASLFNRVLVGFFCRLTTWKGFPPLTTSLANSSNLDSAL